MSNILRFNVRGSAKDPYRVTADGKGESLRIYCTCPAGRKSAAFCKHAQSLILGEVTHVVDPSDDVIELARRVLGSSYMSKAMLHVSVAEKKRVVEGMASLKDVYEKYYAELSAKGFIVKLEKLKWSPGRGEALNCYGYGKHGKLLKSPLISLEWNESSGVLVASEDGDVEFEDIRPRNRPWSLKGRDVQTNTWAELGRAVPAFLNAAGIVVN